MFTAVDQLPPGSKKRLEHSWAYTFYRTYFSKIDEETFAVLCSGKKFRPNTPVNILVDFETLKSGFGWGEISEICGSKNLIWKSHPYGTV